ncbi:MAG TPA: choice-of-anchor Q domain-containing protein [Thermoanaerobaculia bacterium]|jgi:parallel beta-helix repeat protein|nr:choice-of-anchor Q domain-containing protein [Thermoanaerobaculia bacterium]
MQKESRQRRRAAVRKGKKNASKGAAAASGAVLTLGAALASVPAAQAATFNVTNLNDSGAGSLRQAIEDANGAAGADVITFQAGLTGTITLTTGQLEITDSVDVQGPGAAALTVSGNDSSRVFYLYNGSALLDVTISGLTVTGGMAALGAGIADLGENLVLDGVTITENEAGAFGGGLAATECECGDGFALTIRDSVISGNTAFLAAGGIYLGYTGGPLLIQNTVISGNQAGYAGGGIFLYAAGGDTTIVDSTISGNQAGYGGGGMFFLTSYDGTHTIRGTTISGNSAPIGGGLFLYSLDDPFVIENSTISGNQATAGDGGGVYLYSFYNDVTFRHTTIAGNSASGSGGGLFSVAATVEVENTIVGDNTAAADNDLCGPDGTYNLRFSLVEDPGTANVNDNGGNIFNQDPQLGPLQNNGGPTETHLPAGTSPAVNAGDPAFAPPPSTDQRGFSRVVNGRIDMGAVEVNPGTIQLTMSAASVNENAGTVTITATRTGGTDGAVSVSFATSDGTAVAPGDYTSAAGNLNWASGDGAPKTFQVTIVNDPDDEPDETFNATINNPQGGAALGAITTEVVTILDDDEAVPIPAIPTLGDSGKLLFAALCGLGGFLLLRRRKGLAAPMLAVSLTLGAATGVQAAAKNREIRAAALAQIESRGNTVVIHLADGATYEIGSDHFRLIERRKGRRGQQPPGLAALPANQPVLLKVRHGRDGEVKHVRVVLMDTAAKAQAAAQNETE